jgi:hypothetical protein
MLGVSHDLEPLRSQPFSSQAACSEDLRLRPVEQKEASVTMPPIASQEIKPRELLTPDPEQGGREKGRGLLMTAPSDDNMNIEETWRSHLRNTT